MKFIILFIWSILFLCGNEAVNSIYSRATNSHKSLADKSASDASSDLSEAIEHGKSFLEETAGYFTEKVKEYANTVTGFASSQLSNIRNTANDKYTKVSSNISKAGSYISDNIVTATEHASENIVKATDYLGDKIDSAGSYISDNIVTATEHASENIVKATDYLGDKVDSAGSYISDNIVTATEHASENIAKATDYLGDKVDSAGSYISDNIVTATEYINENIVTATEYLSGKYEEAKSVASNQYTKATDKAAGAADFVSEKVDGAKSAVKDQFSSATDYVNDKMDDAKEAVKDRYTSAADNISSAAGHVNERIETAKSAIKDKNESYFKHATDAFNDVKSTLKEEYGKSKIITRPTRTLTYGEDKSTDTLKGDSMDLSSKLPKKTGSPRNGADMKTLGNTAYIKFSDFVNSLLDFSGKSNSETNDERFRKRPNEGFNDHKKVNEFMQRYSEKVESRLFAVTRKSWNEFINEVFGSTVSRLSSVYYAFRSTVKDIKDSLPKDAVLEHMNKEHEYILQAKEAYNNLVTSENYKNEKELELILKKEREICQRIDNYKNEKKLKYDDKVFKHSDQLIDVYHNYKDGKYNRNPSGFYQDTANVLHQEGHPMAKIIGSLGFTLIPVTSFYISILSIICILKLYGENGRYFLRRTKRSEDKEIYSERRGNSERDSGDDISEKHEERRISLIYEEPPSVYFRRISNPYWIGLVLINLFNLELNKYSPYILHLFFIGTFIFSLITEFIISPTYNKFITYSPDFLILFASCLNLFTCIFYVPLL